MQGWFLDQKCQYYAEKPTKTKKNIGRERGTVQRPVRGLDGRLMGTLPISFKFLLTLNKELVRNWPGGLLDHFLQISFNSK